MAGLKRRLDRLETKFNDLVLMRRGDRAAADRLFQREWTALVNDIYAVPDLYATEVERVIASAPDSVAAQYRAAWTFIPAMIESDRLGNDSKALHEQFETAIDALPKLNGGQLISILQDFYRAVRPGFKLSDDDLEKVAVLFFPEGTK